MNDDYEESVKSWVMAIDSAKGRLNDPGCSEVERGEIYQQFPGLHPEWPKNLGDGDLQFVCLFDETLSSVEHAKLLSELEKRGLGLPRTT